MKNIETSQASIELMLLAPPRSEVSGEKIVQTLMQDHTQLMKISAFSSICCNEK